MESLVIALSIVTKLRVRRPKNHGSIRGGSKGVIFLQNTQEGSWGLHSFQFIVYRGVFARR